MNIPRQDRADAGTGCPAIRVVARPAFRTRKWNPYNWLLYTHLKERGVEVEESTRRRVVRGGYDVLHLHWPEQHLNHESRSYAFLRSATLLAQLWWARLRGAKVVWTVHNLRAHERRYPRFERLFWAALLPQLDAYICLTRRSQELALEHFPRLRQVSGQVIPHGDYRSVYPNELSRQEARERLGLAPDARVLVFVGALREYKNVPGLIAAFRGVQDSDAVLLIAGRPADDAIRRSVEELARPDPRIRLYLGFVADEDLQLYLNASDAVVLPYLETLNSGSAILALSFHRPVLMPVSTCGEELRECIGPDWVDGYQGRLTSEHLTGALRWSTRPGRPVAPSLEELSWPRIARMTEAVYEQMVGRAGDPLPAEPRAPLVSIITPCHNAAPFIAETIESVAAQSHGAIEHIIVDDGSTDASWETIQRYGDRVRAVRLPENRGGCHARNHGASLARGEFLMFLDADDTIAPDTIAALLAAMVEEPGSIACCDWVHLRATRGRWAEAPRERPLPSAGADPLKGWLEGVWVPPCAVLWPRELYLRTGGWDEGAIVNQDGDLMMRAFADGARLRVAAGGRGRYRDHGAARATVSRSVFSERHLRALQEILEKVVADLDGRGLFPVYRRSIGIAYQRLALGAYQQMATRLGDEFTARGLHYAGRHAIARTRAGRVLTRVLGMRRKERLVTALARAGLATQARRDSIRLREDHGPPGSWRPSRRPRGGE